jgi:hypothetical protein
VQRYPVRVSHRTGLTTAGIEAICRSWFEEVQVAGERVAGRYGAISTIQVWPAGRELAIDVTMDPKVPEDVARETIRRYNGFLEEMTGYSTKERARRLKKSAAPPEA